LTDYEDQYKVNDAKSRGANLMFYRIFFGMASNSPLYEQIKSYKYFMYMEPDVLPVKPYWLDRYVIDLCADTSNHLISAYEEIVLEPIDFWIKGSAGKIPNVTWNSMNGNAFYKLHDKQFDEYLAKVSAAYGDKSYDGAIYSYTQNKVDLIREVLRKLILLQDNWKINAQTKHRFIYTDYFNDMNTYHNESHIYTNTYVAHISGGMPRNC
jgi:hypothetical protein